MDIKAKLYLVDEQGEKFMGIGVLWLLERVDETGSLRSAASSLGISYSKAFSMVRTLEEKLGVEVLERKKGGAFHEGSSLTGFGRRFIALYDAFQADAKQRLVGPFDLFCREVAELVREYCPPKGDAM